MKNNMQDYIEQNYLSKELVENVMKFYADLQLPAELELLFLRSSLRKGELLTIDEMNELTNTYQKES